MPTITPETPTDEATIAGSVFKVYTPYAVGHTLTENEAASLNQTFVENIRNNFAKTVKTHKEAGTLDEAGLQTALNDYMATYEFGTRKGRASGLSTPRVKLDPITSRAVELAREAVRAAIRAAGGNPKDYSGGDISARAKKAVDENPRFKETAERQLEDEKGLSLPADLDSPPVPSEKKSKAKAAPAEAA